MPLILEPIIAHDGRAVPLPLQGLTVLLVEDSRFAADALRLMCQRLGARLRRAETLRNALAHLALIRPDVVIVDLGLPDGRGEDLIADLAARDPRPRVLLGTSGADDARGAAMAAGADGFLEKPIPSLQRFQEAILCHLPDRQAALDMPVPGAPDIAALRDDLAHAARLLRDGSADPVYVAGFLSGIARVAGDADLLAAVGGDPGGLAALIADRLARVPPL
jgi:CheY-like chemotaxis protein